MPSLLKEKLGMMNQYDSPEDAFNSMAKLLNQTNEASSSTQTSSSSGGTNPVGTIIHSMLTTAQFSSIMGSGWVLADGSACTGSLYASITGATNTPDMRGRFLRGKGVNNPDGDLALGTYTADKLGSHAHNNYKSFPSSGGLTSSTTGSDWSITGVVASSFYPSVTASGGNETSPKSITVNIFIRIN